MIAFSRTRASIVIALFFLAAVAVAPQAESPNAKSGAFVRLLGPIAPIARDIQWIRFQRARLRGDEEEALRLAQSALSFVPESTDGWILLASHLAFLRASPERELSLERRRSWYRAGIETAKSGAERAARPSELDLWRGLLFLSKAAVDPELEAGGERALFALALAAFEEAAARGHSEADELADYVRAQLANEAR